MNNKLAACLILIAYINYFVFYTKLSAIISILILVIGTIVGIFLENKKKKKYQVFIMKKDTEAISCTFFDIFFYAH